MDPSDYHPLKSYKNWSVHLQVDPLLGDIITPQVLQELSEDDNLYVEQIPS